MRLEIRTVAGVLERERRSRAWNGIEALLVMLGVLGVLWPLAYGVGVLGGFAWFKGFSIGLLAGIVIFMLGVSPRLHGDTAGAWGLGTRNGLRAYWRRADGLHRALLCSVLAPLAGAMLWFNHTKWQEILGFFHLRYEFLMGLPESVPGLVLVWAWGGLIVFVFVKYAIRYDNLCSALATALLIALPLCALVIALAFAHRGWDAFHGRPLGELLLQAFGYLFWGFLQQLLFSGYFCTRLRRAVAPAGTGPLWPRRLAVAALVAACFASIHLVSYSLVAATFLLGLPLAYVFMEDRNRNLVALSVVHALLGTTVHWLFAADPSARLFIEYKVGPWNVREPSVALLAVPMAILVAYAVLTLLWVRASRNAR